MATKGWHRISRGWYQYTNAAGKTLAYAERYRSFWNVTVLPMADQARKVDLSASPPTLREAKSVAEIAYKHLTVQAIKADREELDRLKRLGLL